MSDRKLYEIQARRACNFIKFQARLESSRPHKSLCQQSCCQRMWNSTFLTIWATRFMNLMIFRISYYADTNCCSNDISYNEIFHHYFPPVNAHQCNLVLFQKHLTRFRMFTLEILRVFVSMKWCCPFHKNALKFVIVKETENIFVVSAMSDISVWLRGNELSYHYSLMMFTTWKTLIHVK